MTKSSPPTVNQSKLIALAYERSCERLQNQYDHATNFDRRSLIFAGVALAGASFFAPMENPTFAPGLFQCSAFLFLVSAVFAGKSANARKLFVPGGLTVNLREDIDSDTEADLVLLGLAEQNDYYINENAKVEKIGSDLYRVANASFGLATFIAFVGLAEGLTK